MTEQNLSISPTDAQELKNIYSALLDRRQDLEGTGADPFWTNFVVDSLILSLQSHLTELAKNEELKRKMFQKYSGTPQDLGTYATRISDTVFKFICPPAESTHSNEKQRTRPVNRSENS